MRSPCPLNMSKNLCQGSNRTRCSRCCVHVPVPPLQDQGTHSPAAGVVVTDSSQPSPLDNCSHWQRTILPKVKPLPPGGPHLINGQWVDIKAWPLYFNSGRLWSIIVALELPVWLAETFVVTVSKFNFFFCPVIPPSLPP